MAAGHIYFAWTGGDPIPAVSLETTGDLWSGSFPTYGTTWGGSLSTTGDILSGGITVANLNVLTGLIAGHVYAITGGGISGNPTTAGGFIVGDQYTILSLEAPGVFQGGTPTNFMAIGASSNRLGTVFTATGVGAGTGVALPVSTTTTLTYDGVGGGWLSQPCTVAEGVSLTLWAGGTDSVTLEDVSALVAGTDYGIAGGGIQPGTTFAFSGSKDITISSAATATGFTALTITNPNGKNIISHLDNATGMVSGLTYEVFGRGVPAGAQGVYDSAVGSLTLLVDATISGRTVPIAISKDKTYPDGGPFDPAVHLREDEDIFALQISHQEGNFASLQIDIRNPRIGLLAAGRNLWCWLSRDNGVSVVPEFHGRLLGIPENLQGEVVRLQFVACPNDYQAQKTALAETLKARPFWDPIWISQGQDNPDTVLEARPQSWHIDRKTLAVTVSNNNIGEDGTLILTADDHFYDGMEVTYGATPLRAISVSGTVSWTQSGIGSVDLTQQMVDAFRGAGSPYFYPLISSFTGPGLFGSWPQPGANIGGGWSMDASASIVEATWAFGWLLPKVYLRPNYSTPTIIDSPGHWESSGGNFLGAGSPVWRPEVSHSAQLIASWETWGTMFVLSPYKINVVVEWTASRRRTEIISFVLKANVQPLLTDPGDTAVERIELSSTLVAEAVDPGDLLPIRDLRRNSYFNTDRGAQSIEFLISHARAKLLTRARAVNLKVAATWDLSSNLSCRENVQVLDDRLPAGQDSGKVTGYVLKASGDTGEQSGEITLGCSVGYGNVVIPNAGTATHTDDYIDGYYATAGTTLDPGTGDVVYQSLDDLDVLDDDGVDLCNMTPARVLKSITIQGGVNHQAFTTLKSFQDFKIGVRLAEPFPSWDEILAAINATGNFNTIWQFNTRMAELQDQQAMVSASYAEGEDPSTALGRDPTRVSIDLVPIGNRSFETNYAPVVSMLEIPQTINTEAP